MIAVATNSMAPRKGERERGGLTMAETEQECGARVKISPLPCSVVLLLLGCCLLSAPLRWNVWNRR
jgi:hypothetical protein